MWLHEMMRVAVLGMVTLICFAPIAWAGVSTGHDSGLAPSTQPARPEVSQPSPTLSPQQVVRAVITALQKNDANDSGIGITFNFASPENKQVTGPLERFIPMVKSAGYAPLLNHTFAQYVPMEVIGNQAHQLVILTTPQGDKVYYIFQLSKQVDGDLKDCWMTDGVFRIEPGEAPAPIPPDKGGPVKA